MLSVKQKRLRGGFTLIEVIIVLAISSLLALILIGLYSTHQRRARFADAVEGVVTQLDKVKAEVDAGYTTGGGNDPDRVFFGKAVTISSNSIQVQAITAKDQDAVDQLLPVSTPTSTPIPWGVTLSGSQQNYQIVFARNSTDGQLRTYVIPTGQSLYLPTSYNPANSNTPRTLSFQDANNELHATVTIDPVSSQVSRSYAD